MINLQLFCRNIVINTMLLVNLSFSSYVSTKSQRSSMVSGITFRIVVEVLLFTQF